MLSIYSSVTSYIFHVSHFETLGHSIYILFLFSVTQGWVYNVLLPPVFPTITTLEVGRAERE